MRDSMTQMLGVLCIALAALLAASGCQVEFRNPSKAYRVRGNVEQSGVSVDFEGEDLPPENPDTDEDTNESE